MKKLFFSFFFFICLHNASGQTIDSTLIHAMETSIANGTYPNIHSVLISHNGELVYEKYWSGNNVKFGKDLDVITHGVNTLHKIRSVTKNVTSACIGIAIQQGKIKSINQKLFEFFPEYSLQDTGLKSQITIKDLLTMTAGFQWNEADLGSAT